MKRPDIDRILIFSVVCWVFCTAAAMGQISGVASRVSQADIFSDTRDRTVINTKPRDAEVAMSLENKIICIDPGHGGTADTDSYRVGPSGEREEWINLRVGLMLKELLEAKGAQVVMTRSEDVQVPLIERATMALDAKADLFVSIHHNATADDQVNFPIIYFHGSANENLAGLALGKALAEAFLDWMFDSNTPVSLVSDHAIFPKGGASVLRETYGIPGILAEASFFTHPDEEKRLREEEYNRKEA